MRKAFWMFVHDSAEKVWHWVYYNKIKPRQKTDDGVYLYRYSYRNSKGEETQP